jgi:hypothetical protein
LQPSSTRGQQAAPLPAFSPAYTDRLMYQSHQHISHIPVSPQQPPPPPASDIVSRASNQSQNAQYIFYTGHGNYQRKSFDANDLSSSQQQQQPPPPPTYNDPINAFIQHQNYNNNNTNNSFVNSRTQSHQQRSSNYLSNSSGPYINSNIPETPNNNNNNVYNDFRFPSYR